MSLQLTTTTLDPIDWNLPLYAQPKPITQLAPDEIDQKKKEVANILNRGKLSEILALRTKIETRMERDAGELQRSVELNKIIQKLQDMPQDEATALSITKCESLVKKITERYEATGPRQSHDSANLFMIKSILGEFNPTGTIPLRSDAFPYVLEPNREYPAGDFLHLDSSLLPPAGSLIRYMGPADCWGENTKKIHYIVFQAFSGNDIYGVDATDETCVSTFKKGHFARLIRNSSDMYEQIEDCINLHTTTSTISWLVKDYFKYLEESDGFSLEVSFPPPTESHCLDVCQALSIHRTREHHPLNGRLVPFSRNPNFIARLDLPVPLLNHTPRTLKQVDEIMKYGSEGDVTKLTRESILRLNEPKRQETLRQAFWVRRAAETAQKTAKPTEGKAD